ncbi:hypothetical protein D7147_13950 [Micromonospora musae]|uniref:Uncharacterized protein n=1 Tax=Micromonospora musae TaxID=1894970 RepID=A0A3A9XZ64_9ACTN|nr:hypothetical protein [Micromonospora musae]RKN20008.1 hypothetical protein D7147_13950 [Micromonospora musae]RKN30072.1 hypothetical protein D7044_21035 [Micromonospora musae]
MAIRSVAAGPRHSATWLSPLLVLLGTIVVAFLLISPIRIGPGDHEKYASCGNALSMDLSPWANAPNSEDKRYYWEMAHRICTTERIDRVAQAVGALSATLLISAVVVVRRQLRSRSASEPER